MSPQRGAFREHVSYEQAHLRLKVHKGRPDALMCIECGGNAREWAYMGGDPDELTEPIHGRAYSLDQSRYEPMCVSCHRRRDRAAADGRSIDVCPRGHLWAEHGSQRKSRGRHTGLRFCRACHRENNARRRITTPEATTTASGSAH